MTELEKKIQEATDNIYAMADEKADHDETRPAYHFHSPAQWMDDPNGVIWHKGYYHMMYSLNPETDKYRAGMVYKTGSSVWKTSDPDWTGGITVWGHARSKDLLHWEHLPVALYPETDNGEYYIWFGCTAINDEGVPVAIYTSIGYEDRNPTDSAIQHIWFGDDDLIKWKPGTDVNPIMTEELHQGKKVWEWRDPFLFRQNGKAYLILGGKEDAEDGGKAAVFLYEALNAAFTKWSYKGVLFEFPDPGLRSCECPNIVQLGEKWVIFVSPHGPVQYFVGDLDAEKCSFTWEKCGYVDRSTHFYATNVIEDGSGRKLLWGAIEGFENHSGWNGVNSLPREICLDGDGTLIQKVAGEICNLCKEDGKVMAVGETVDTGTFIMDIRFEAGKIGEISIGDNVIRLSEEVVEAEGVKIPFPTAGSHAMKLYVDRSTAELIIDDKEAFTLMLNPVVENVQLSWTIPEAAVTVYELDADNLFTRYGA